MTERIYGRHTVAAALGSDAPIHRLLLAEGVEDSEILDEITGLARERQVPVDRVRRSDLDELVQANHQGVVAEVDGYRYRGFDELVAGDECRLLLLDGVTDPQNVGSMIRSAEAFGFTGVLLPRRRSAEVTPAVRRVAVGAAERVGVAQVGSPAATVSRLQDRRVFAVGLAEGAEEVYDEVEYPQRVALVLGAEGKGLGRLASDRCDLLVRIPTAGAMSSVNVAVAAAVVMIAVTRSRRPVNR